MEKVLLFSAVLLANLLAHGLTVEVLAVKIFYVKPNVPRATECPSSDFPCHSLQYYANYSNLSNNSKFLFLEGEHHLDSVATISNVANLSLVGLSSGVEVLCKSVPSGFRFEEFIGLNIENLAITNCSGSDNTSLSLLNGSDVTLNRVTITGHNADELMATNVVGDFSVHASAFLGGHIVVNYSLCYGPSHFNFSRSKLQDAELYIGIHCSDLWVLIDDSWLFGRLGIDYSVLTNTSVVLSNSALLSSGATFVLCDGTCNHYSLHCNGVFLKITNTTFNVSDIFFDFISTNTENCTILIEDSISSGQSIFAFTYDASESDNDTTINGIVRNTSFVGRNHESGMGVQNSVIFLSNAAILFVNCTFENNTGSSLISAQFSKVVFQANNVFRNSSAPIGAGIRLMLGSYMYLEPHTNILFEGNHADYVGGAIYTDSKPGEQCFYRDTDSIISEDTVTVNFFRNTANFAGSSIYGYAALCKDFYNIFNTSNTETDPSAIASDPYKVCLCDADKLQPNCSNSNMAYSTSTFPGQVFSVHLAVVGRWFDGVVTGAVRAYLDNSINATVGPIQSSQTSDRPFCEIFNYSINSTERMVTFQLIPEQYFFQLVTTGTISRVFVSVHVDLLDCPLGFSLSPLTGSCVCDHRLMDNNIECNINNQSFLHHSNSWLGFIDESSTASSETGVMFHPNCPIGYCLPCDVSITSNTSDDQCEPHRTGLLCGKCEDGYSLTLGNQKCKKCSNTYLLLILPFVVAGLFLVAVLFALNLTVAEGSINGLIFYANVMAMNQTIRFSGEASYLYTFLAWLNLDLGISTCLYEGMDGYVETWLQLVFPVYLWVIILVVVLLYNKFRANSLGGNNSVRVLATILLLSYTKLQRTVVTILSFTWLEYPDGVVRYVWLHDPNVEFFKGKHLYLGIAGILVFVFLIVPYTLCLAFFQQLQACSGRRLFQWVNKLKPVFDSYAGPYKDKYRFWTGMLLVVRTLLIVLFTANTAGSTEVNLLIISVVSCTLLLANSNGAYEKWPYNFLESFFYLQLAVFAGAAFYTRSADINGDIKVIADTSISLSIAVFLAIVGYHVFCRLSLLKTRYYNLKGYTNAEEYVHDRMTGPDEW